MSSPSTSLDPDFPPAQRIKALELIGKMTEVALFTERREIVQVTDAAQIRERLMDTLRTITQAQVTDVTDTAADSLLAELAGPASRTRAGRDGAASLGPWPSSPSRPSRQTFNICRPPVPPTPQAHRNFLVPPLA
jgi:hypothetical protein